MANEQKTRAVAAEMGIPPGAAAVSLKAAKEALLAHMPQSDKDAMPAAELFAASLIPSIETGKRALRELLEEGQIQSQGKGVTGDPRRYWLDSEA